MSWRRDPYKTTPGLPAEPRPEPTTPPPGPSGISDLPPALGYHRPDPATAPPRDELPPPPIPEPPHCDGVHGPGACQWCDALAGTITVLRHQEAVRRDHEARLALIEQRLGIDGSAQ